MKTHRAWIQVLPALTVAALTLPSSINAQLAGSGTPGDRAVYTVGAGATIADNNALPGNSLVHNFDTAAVADTADSFDLGANGVVSLTAGHHIVLYGTYFDSVNDRASTDTFLKLNGAAIPYGASSGYTRDTGNDDLFSRGGTIINVAQADTIEVETERVDVQADNQGQRAITEQGADLQFVKLDDANLEFLRLSVSSSSQIMAGQAEGPVNVSFDVQDEPPAGSFAHSTTTDSDQITLKTTGHYLIFANTGFVIAGATNRNELTQRLLLGGSPLPGGSTTVYIRNASNTDGAGAFCREGAASIGVIVEVTVPDTVLQVETTRDNVNSASTVTLNHERTGLAIAKLPSYGDYIALTGAAQNVNTGAPTVRDFSASANVTNSTFAYDSGASASQITVNMASDCLFLSSHYGISTSATQTQRMIVRQEFQTTPSGGSAAAVSYGGGGIYNRDDHAGADRSRNSGAWAGAVLAGLGSGDTVETTTDAFSSTADTITTSSLGIQALNIGSISAPPTVPVIDTNLPLNVLVSSLGTVVDDALLHTTHSIEPATGLTYTIDTAITGGTLRLSGNPLAMSGTFTQDDLDNDRLTFDAGAAESVGGGFDFTVRDSSANAESATFTINVGVVTSITADAGATDEDTTATEADLSTGATLLANDTGTGLSVTDFDATSPNGAAVAVNGDGTFTYDPTGSGPLQALDTGGSIMDTFGITITDAFGVETPSTVTITVDGLNDDPVVVDDASTGSNQFVQNLNLLANDSDVDTGDTLQVVSINGTAVGIAGATALSPDQATITVSQDGTFTYDPGTSASVLGLAGGAANADSFPYEVSDGTATVQGTITITSIGATGANNDVATVAANATAMFNALANDSTFGAAGTPTAGALVDFNAADVGNTNGTWLNNGTGTGVNMTMESPGTGSVLNTALVGAPVGITAAYDLSGTGSGAALEDADNTNSIYGANISTADLVLEMVFRPDDLVGNEPLWGSGGNGTGSSLVLLGDQLIFTAGQGAVVLQVVGTLSSASYVHVIVTVDLATDTAELYINNVLADTSTAINITDGAAADITDWSGTDNEGLGRSAGTTGGDINVAPFLGAQGTTDIPDFNDANDRFDGEIAILRIYSGTLLTPAERTANFEAVFRMATPATVGDVTNIAGTASPTPPQTINLPSGATVTFNADGTFTYDPNGAFDHVATGLEETDSFEYTLNSSGAATATVTVRITGTNTDPQVTIAADQSNVTEGSLAGFTLSAASNVVGDVSVNLSYTGTASDGPDYTGQASRTIAGGTDSVDLDLVTIADSLFENGAETIIVTIDSVTGAATVGAPNSAGTTLDDGDSAPVFTISTPPGNTTEGSTVDFTATASVASDVDVTLDVAYSGTADPADYPPIPQVTILAGQTAATLSLLAFDDGLAEADETVIATISNPSQGTVGAPDNATGTIQDGAGLVVFMADFEGINPLDTPGGTLLNADAPFAANLGTAIGSWANVFTADAGGNDPGVILEGGADVKGDGVDSALRLDRPGDGDGFVCAQFDGAIDLRGSGTGVITFDLATRRTENNSIAKSTTILGLDELGNKAFELFVDANNNGAAREQLFHVDSAGVKTPIGNAEDFNNSGNYNEDRMSNVRIGLTNTGYTVSVDRFPLGPTATPETTTGELPYAGNARVITQLVFDISGSASAAISGGIFVDELKASGSALTTQEAWRLAYFGSTANSGDGADDNDFNGNGNSNLLDFTLGIDPVTVGGSAAIELEVTNPGPNGVITQFGGITIFADGVTGEVFMRYARRADHAAVGLDITDQFSRDDLVFEDATEDPVVIATGVGDDGIKVEVVQIKFPLTLPLGGKARFGRIQVTITP